MPILGLEAFGKLLDQVKQRGYQLVGPTMRDGAVLFEEIEGFGELPQGCKDAHGRGKYRVQRNGSPALFDYASGPRAIKHFLIPPRRLLYRVLGSDSDFTVERPQTPAPAYAFIGVRACDLAGLALQDRIFLQGPYVDPEYKARREKCLLIAVNCSTPSENCFCASMGTGPRVTAGYDLVLTEVCTKKQHYFTLETGSELGEEVVEGLKLPAATPAQEDAAAGVLAGAEAALTRRVEMRGLREALFAEADSDYWEEVADRCLACANCTMACPTCFCATVEDVTSLNGTSAERSRVWDSCFTTDFSYIHGGAVRKSTSSRYRQWLTHKFASWQDQFGAPGCVGCGRCITWCPAGIDVTEETAAVAREHARKIGG